MTRESSILLTIIAYQLVLVGIGFMTRRRMQSGVDFFLAGRNLGPIVAALSASASSSSAWTLLAVSGIAYQYGLAAVWLFPACVGGFLLNWLYVAPRLQRLAAERQAITLTEVLAFPYDGEMRRWIVRVSSIIVIFSLSIYVGSQFYGAGKTFESTFGWGARESILVGSAIVLIYTFWGGFWAVSMTDTLQGLLMVATAVLLPVAAVIKVGGWGDLAHGIGTLELDFFHQWTREFQGPAAIGFVAGTLGIGLGYPGQPHVVNRFMALRPGRSSLRTARFVAITWAVLVYSGMIVLGWCGRVLFPELTDSETLFIYATNELFPPAVAGLMIAAVLSAIMSTADSQLLVAASSITHDLNLGGRPGQSLLVRSRYVVLGLGVVSVSVAWIMIGNAQIFSSVLFAWSALGAAFGPLLLVTLRGSRVPAGQCLAAIIVGFSSSVLLAWTTTSPGKIFENVLPFVLAWVIASWPRKRA